MSEHVFDNVDALVRERTKTMLMYFIIFSVTMLFAGFTSAYIVQNLGSEYWIHVEAPSSFLLSNVLIVLSSVTLWGASRLMQSGKARQALAAMGFTVALGLGFTWTQYQGWKTLESFGLGWSTVTTENGEARKKNTLEAILESDAVYGKDYDVRHDGVPLNYNYGELYKPDGNSVVTDDVKVQSDNGGAYLAILVFIHVAHLALGLIYLLVNAIRIYQGVIHRGDTVRLKANGIFWHFLGLLWLALYAFLFILH